MKGVILKQIQSLLFWQREDYWAKNLGNLTPLSIS
jgi:hypothetical protein